MTVILLFVSSMSILFQVIEIFAVMLPGLKEPMTTSVLVMRILFVVSDIFVIFVLVSYMFLLCIGR